MVGEAGILGEDADLPFVGGLVRPRGGDVQGQHVLHVLRQHGGAVADLLVEGEVGVDLPGQAERAVLQGLHGRQQHGGGGLVVQEAGFDVVSRKGEAGLQGDHVPGGHAQGFRVRIGAHVLVQHHADIGAEIPRRGAQLLLRHMDGIGGAADRPGIGFPVPGVDAHVLRDAVEGVEAPHGADVQGAVRVHLPHHEADVVQVGGDGQGLPLAPQVGDDASLPGDAVGVAQLVQHFAEQGLHFFILPGGAVHGDELPEIVQAGFPVKGGDGM